MKNVRCKMAFGMEGVPFVQRIAAQQKVHFDRGTRERVQRYYEALRKIQDDHFGGSGGGCAPGTAAPGPGSTGAWEANNARGMWKLGANREMNALAAARTRTLRPGLDATCATAPCGSTPGNAHSVNAISACVKDVKPHTRATCMGRYVASCRWTGQHGNHGPSG